MSKFKVGDKVRVKSWDELCKKYNYGNAECEYLDLSPDAWDSFTFEMKDFCGQVVTIESDYSNGSYFIAEEKDKYNWYDCLFEPEVVR